MTVIENGIDVQRFQHAKPVSRASVGASNSNCVLLYVASLQPRKDHTNLLRAMTHIPDVDLVLAGDGELRPQLERLAETLGVAPRVHFLGRRKDVAELLKMADIYVHPPAFEGFGIAAAEAMAAAEAHRSHQCPGTCPGGGRCCHLGRARRLAASAREVCNLIKSGDRRSQLSRVAVERVQRFSIEATVAAYIDLYSSVLSH